MAMIRGRKMQAEVKVQQTDVSTSGKLMPLARLKEQRRLTIGYSSSPEKVLTAIGDPDPFYKDKKTFLVLNSDRLIYRFSDEKSLFLFGRNSKIRMGFIKLLINNFVFLYLIFTWFNGIVITTILLNCLVMIINGNNKYKWSEDYVENVFTAIYTVEMVVKIAGRGFVMHSFSYLRDPWNWIDFVVIVAAYVLIIMAQTENSGKLSSLTFLRAIRVLRVFKTVSVIPGLRTIVSALVASTKALKDVMLLSLLGFSMFSLIGIQVFRGTLQHKCVLLPPWELPPPSNCIHHDSNWTKSDDVLCSFQHYDSVVSENFGETVRDEMFFLFTQLLKDKSNDTFSNAPWSVPIQGDSDSIVDRGVRGVPPTRISRSDGNASRNGELPTSLDGPSCDGQVRNHSDWTFRVRDNSRFRPTGYEFVWTNWISHETDHYFKMGDVYRLCGNRSTAVKCPSYTTCIRAGSNPNFGYTSFDNFLYAFLSVFRLSLQDNWEELYLQIMETNGQAAFFFFIVVIFLGSYYLVNLILAVVASAYDSQRKDVADALEEEKRELLSEKEILTKRRNAARTTSDITKQSQRMQRAKSCFDSCTCYDSFREIFLQWSCCVGSSLVCRIREKLQDFFANSVSEMITVTLVVLNTLFMALDRQPIDEAWQNVLATSNIVFTMLFTVEMVLKIFALSPYNYFNVSWNIFDFVVVTLSLMEVFIFDNLPGMQGLSVLRTFRLIRLVRILKLARSWPTLSKLMQMIGDSLSKVGYLTLVLLIVLVIFALAGMQTVGPQFYMDRQQGIPLRWHMNDFAHAFLVVFRIQCGEWIQSMWRCMHSVSEEGSVGLFPVCIFIFLGVVIVGNLVVLNLFLALLLNSFSSEALNSGSSKKRKSAKQFLSSIKHVGKKALPKMVSNKKSSKVAPVKSQSVKVHSEVKSSNGNHQNDKNSNSNSIKVPRKRHSSLGGLLDVRGDGCDSREESEVERSHKNGASSDFEKGPTPQVDNGANNHSNTVSTRTESTSSAKHSGNVAWASLLGKFCQRHPRGAFARRWKAVRVTMNKVVQHTVFETFIIFVIFLSSGALVFDDVYLPTKPTLKFVLMIFDRIFTAIFFIEMIMKWIGLGFKKYFTNGWCLLDFFIVLVSLISLSLEIVATSPADLSFLRVLRSLRAFRPLRAMSRFQGIKVVTDALFRSIPSIVNVFVICLIFWLIFAIMGVNFFAGKMSSCQWRETGEKVWHPKDFETWPDLKKHYEMPPINVTNRQDCECLAKLTGDKVHWKNLEVNFDNVFIAYVSLLQVATFKGWMPIMYAAVDSPSEIGEQPIRDNNVAMYYFFVAFIIFGAFFTLNLFISVVIDNFNQQKNKFKYAGAELFLTDNQKRFYSAVKKLKAKLPKKLIPVPKAQWREKLYLHVTSDKFELGVMIITILNLVAMALEYEGMSAKEIDALQIISYVFLGMFTIEIFLRIVAMGKSYFFVAWNIFDFLVIFGSLLANVITLAIQQTDGPVSVPTSPWLPMLRMIRIARILRIARVASGIRTLLFALMLSAPALFNVGSLLFLFMFIYAIFGMSQFSNVEKKGALNDVLNFETFPNTFLLLFQMSTSAGWDGFMEPTLYTDGPDPECNPGLLPGEKRTCMNSTFVGYFYFISYLLITFVIVTNMYIAIILENFDLATKDNEEALTADDFEHFFDMWQRFDKSGNGKLTVDQLSDLLHIIDQPIQMRKPNKTQIASMRIPMCEGYELQLVDVASALIKKIIGSDGCSSDMEDDLKAYYSRKSKIKEPYDTNWVTDTHQYIERLKQENDCQIEGLGVAAGVRRLAKLVKDNLVNVPVMLNLSQTGLASNEPSKHYSDELGANKAENNSCNITRADVHHEREPEMTLSSNSGLCRRATLVITSSRDSESIALASEASAFLGGELSTNSLDRGKFCKRRAAGVTTICELSELNSRRPLPIGDPVNSSQQDSSSLSADFSKVESENNANSTNPPSPKSPLLAIRPHRPLARCGSPRTGLLPNKRHKFAASPRSISGDVVIEMPTSDAEHPHATDAVR